MLYLIGLGLNLAGITKEGLNALPKCKTLYLEGYTVDFPYSIEDLEKELGKKVTKLMRNEVESDKLIKEAKKEDIALLVYGCPLFATTHMTLIIDAQKAKVKIRVVYSASVFDAISETGLQLYKFGKITSMPAWQKNFSPDSFMDIVKENNSINAHSLILIDIGLGFENAMLQLKQAADNKKMKIDKILVCSKLGTENSKVFYSSIEEILKKSWNKIELPFCIIIPSELHFAEKEALESLKNNR